MDQLKVKDRILENISLSVKKVSSAGQLTEILSRELIIFHMLELLWLTLGHLLSAKEGNFQVGGTLPARCHGRALPLLI